MTAPAERTTSMRAYAETFGAPDQETSARLEQRLDIIIAEDERRRRRGGAWPRRLAASLLVGVALTATWWWLAAPGDRGVVSSSDRAQQLRLAAGHAVLAPDTRVRVLHDEGRSVLALESGAIDAEADPDAVIEILAGPYAIEGTGARFRVQSTDAVPIVSVSSGQATVRGPELPEHGIVVVPVGGS